MLGGKGFKLCTILCSKTKAQLIQIAFYIAHAILLLNGHRSQSDMSTYFPNRGLISLFIGCVYVDQAIIIKRSSIIAVLFRLSLTIDSPCYESYCDYCCFFGISKQAISNSVFHHQFCFDSHWLLWWSFLLTRKVYSLVIHDPKYCFTVGVWTFKESETARVSSTIWYGCRSNNMVRDG